jgi:hypothetical protein
MGSVGGHGRAPARGLLMAGVALAVLLAAGWAIWSSAPGATVPLASPPEPTPLESRRETAPPPTATAMIAPSPPATPTRVAPVRAAPEAFGPLPPLDLPGAGPFGVRPRLGFERAAGVPAPPAAADVYRLTWTRFTPESVRALRDRLGLTGEVEQLGPEAFQVQDGARGRLFVAHGRIVFSNRAGPPPTPTPPRVEELIPVARRWLQERALYPPNAGPPRVGERADHALGTVHFPLAEPAPMLTSEPGIVVTLDAAGRVQEMDWFWPATVEVASYPLADLASLWEATRRGDAFVDLDIDPRLTAETRPSGLVHIDAAALAYALAGGGDAGETAYLEPVVVFTGLAWLDGRTTPVACRVHVPAVRDYRWPRG